jgi:hypothetical protein
MKSKTLLAGLLVLLIGGCVEEQAQVLPEKQPLEPAVIKAAPNATQDEESAEESVADRINEEIKALLEKSKSVKSVYYKYKGPETSNHFYVFYVIGDKIKYEPAREIKSLDDEGAYNAIYVDKSEKTAEAYCDAQQCRHKGKKADLKYGDYYIPTPFDWAAKITSAEKIGEELIGNRRTWKIESNDGITAWIDLFYGVPLQVVQNGVKYEFAQMAFNTLSEADVVPQP